MFRLALYWTLLALVIAMAWWRGDRDIRIAAMICLLATIGSLSSLNPFSFEGIPIKASVGLIDVMALAAFTFIALRSDHFWPLWIAGLQLTTTLSHVLRLLFPDLIQVAYDAAMKLWSYPLLVILGVAAWRHARDVGPLERSAAD
jgi:hypothetical protein